MPAGTEPERAVPAASSERDERRRQAASGRLLTARSLRIVLSFALIYLAWGSSYLATSVGVRPVPPLVFGGTRFIATGLILILLAWRRGSALPRGRDAWRGIVLSTLLMQVGASGLAAWAQRTVPSSVVALAMASTGLWLAVFGAWGRSGQPLARGVIAGLMAGFVGVMLLVSGGWRSGDAPVSAYLAISLAPLLWAAGSIVVRTQASGCDAMTMAAWQALLGGLTLFALGYRQWAEAHWTAPAVVALAYLVVVASAAGYVAYFWLLRNVSTPLVGTYAFVNPLVALVLGALILGETLTLPQWLGAAAVLVSVAAIGIGSLRKP